MSLSLKAKVSLVATLAVAGVAILAYRSYVPAMKERKEHAIEVSVAFSPSPRLSENEYVSVHLTANNHTTRDSINQSQWDRSFPAETGDTVAVTARQGHPSYGTISCRIKVDGEERDHDITKTHELQITCLVVL